MNVIARLLVIQKKRKFSELEKAVIEDKLYTVCMPLQLPLWLQCWVKFWVEIICFVYRRTPLLNLGMVEFDLTAKGDSGYDPLDPLTDWLWGHIGPVNVGLNSWRTLEVLSPLWALAYMVYDSLIEVACFVVPRLYCWALPFVVFPLFYLGISHLNFWAFYGKIMQLILRQLWRGCWWGTRVIWITSGMWVWKRARALLKQKDCSLSRPLPLILPMLKRLSRSLFVRFTTTSAGKFWILIHTNPNYLSTG